MTRFISTVLLDNQISVLPLGKLISKLYCQLWKRFTKMGILNLYNCIVDQFKFNC